WRASTTRRHGRAAAWARRWSSSAGPASRTAAWIPTRVRRRWWWLSTSGGFPCPPPSRYASSLRLPEKTSRCTSWPKCRPRMPTGSINLERYAWLSVAAALDTMGLKTLAWWLTDSVGLLSDAIESLVNLAAAFIALSMLRLAAKQPNKDHPYGFSKAEYFSAGIEGALIMLAAAGIMVTALPRLAAP